jgi:hypothetical protein
MENSEDRGRQASIDGFAHEHIVAGILMKRFQNVSLVDLPLSPYDIIIAIKKEDGHEDIIRAQVKTSRTSISFTGGTRGGVDREYISGIKEYIQSPITSDVVIGIKPISFDTFELYFVPTILITIWKTKSKSLNKIEPLKNNYEILEKCKDFEFVINKSKHWGIIP